MKNKLCAIQTMSLSNNIESLTGLKTEIEKMISIWYSAETYFRDNMYLLEPETEEEKVVAHYDLFIKRARYALGVMSVLQLYKLYGGDNDDFSIKKFLNKLLNTHKNSEWKEKIPLNSIKSWQTELQEQTMAENITKVKGLRDQYYAHSDRNPEAFEKLVMKSDEMRKLLKFCEDVLLKISVDVFNQYYYSMISETEKASGILKRLSVHVTKKERL